MNIDKKEYDKYDNMINHHHLRMYTNSFIITLLQSLIGDATPRQAKDFILNKYNIDAFTADHFKLYRMKTPAELNVGLELNYPAYYVDRGYLTGNDTGNDTAPMFIRIPIDIKSTRDNLSYQANKEYMSILNTAICPYYYDNIGDMGYGSMCDYMYSYLDKYSGYIILKEKGLPTDEYDISGLSDILFVNENRIPLFVYTGNTKENKERIADIFKRRKKISINNIEIEIDTFLNNTKEENTINNKIRCHKEFKTRFGNRGFDEYSKVDNSGNYAYNVNVSAPTTYCRINYPAAGRHCKYMLSNLSTFETVDNVVKTKKSVNHNSMVYDTLALSSRALSRHLTWEEWNDMRQGTSPYYPLPVQVTFEFKDIVSDVEAGDENYMNMPHSESLLYVGDMVLRDFHGLFTYPLAGLDLKGLIEYRRGLEPKEWTAGDIGKFFENHDFHHPFHFSTILRIPRNVPSLILTDSAGRTEYLELESVQNAHTSNPRTELKDVDNTTDNILSYLDTLDPNGFLLPAERSVMEFHNFDQV